MEYIEIKDYIIIGHYCGEIPDEKNPTIEYREVENCIANIGEDIRFYSDLSAGIIQLSPDEKIENEHIVKKTEKEKYDDRLISKEAYNAFIDAQRQAAYKQESDPLGMQVLRGELDKAEWLTKIEEIKKRYPKAE